MESNGHDRWLDRVALGTLAGVVLLGGAGLMLLASIGRQPPEQVASLVSAALGALVGWFGRARCKHSGP